MPPSTSMSSASPRASAMRREPPDLLRTGRDVALAAEPGVDGHDQDLAAVAEHPLERGQVGGRVERHRGRAPAARGSPAAYGGGEARPRRARRSRSAPASANASTYRSGSTIIRCTSSGRRVASRTAFTTSGPMVMLGTNRPSMTSTWIDVRAGRLGRPDLVGEAAEVGREDRGSDVDGGEEHGEKCKRSPGAGHDYRTDDGLGCGTGAGHGANVTLAAKNPSHPCRLGSVSSSPSGVRTSGGKPGGGGKRRAPAASSAAAIAGPSARESEQTE